MVFHVLVEHLSAADDIITEILCCRRDIPLLIPLQIQLTLGNIIGNRENLRIIWRPGKWICTIATPRLAATIP